MCGFPRMTRAGASNASGTAAAGTDGLPIRFSCTSMAAYRRDTEHLPPRAKVDKALAALVPAALGAWFLFAFVPQLSWLVFAFGWTLFPAVALLARGIVGLTGATQAGASPGRMLRAFVDVGRRRVEELMTSTRTVAVDEIDARLARLWRAARLVEAPAAREDALRVCEAADRLVTTVAASDVDARTARGLLDRALAPAEDMLGSYARLATDRSPAAEPTLRDVENCGLPLLAAKLDALADGLRRERVGGTTAPVGEPPTTELGAPPG